jgi:hypothetical protein
MDDPDTFAPAVSDRTDCYHPHACVCAPDDPCQFEALERMTPQVRTDVEMPHHGE